MRARSAGALLVLLGVLALALPASALDHPYGGPTPDDDPLVRCDRVHPDLAWRACFEPGYYYVGEEDGFMMLTLASRESECGGSSRAVVDASTSSAPSQPARFDSERDALSGECAATSPFALPDQISATRAGWDVSDKPDDLSEILTVENREEGVVEASVEAAVGLPTSGAAPAIARSQEQFASITIPSRGTPARAASVLPATSIEGDAPAREPLKRPEAREAPNTERGVRTQALARVHAGAAAGWESPIVVAFLVLGLSALALALYHRLGPSQATLHPIRQAILAKSGERPGILVTELARELGVDRNTVLYHLRVLERAQAVRLTKVGPARLVFLAGTSPREREVREALRAPVARSLLARAASTPTTVLDLACELGVAPQSVRAQAKRLQALGLVEIRWNGERNAVTATADGALYASR